MSEASGPRVLHVFRRLGTGGIGRQISGFIRHASDPSAHHVALLWGGDTQGEPLPNPPVVAGTAGASPYNLLRDAVAARAVRRLIRERRIDLVHAYGHLPSVLASLAVPGNVPLVVSRHAMVPKVDRWWFRAAEPLCYRRVRAVIVVSEALRATLPAGRSYPPVHVIHDAIDLDRFPPAPPPPAEVPPTVTVVARLVPVKRHGLFLRALALLAAGPIPDVRAILVGDGPERERLETLVARLGLGEQVRFTGETGDVRPFLAEAHVAALTSASEGFGDVLVEAMAVGRPLVATRGGAIGEVVRDGVDGLVTGGDPVEVAAALERLLTDDDLRARMAASALERAQDFGWPRKVREQEALYRRLIGAG